MDQMEISDIKLVIEHVSKDIRRLTAEHTNRDDGVECFVNSSGDINEAGIAESEGAASII